jgi:hypothetical protein
MSTLTSYASEAARDSAAPAASNTGLCIFRTDTNAIEVSDGTNYHTYNSDGVIAHSFPTNTKALDFDGSNDYVSVAHSSDLSISGAMSITAWVKPDSLSGFPMFVSKRAGSGHAYQFYSTGNKLNYNNGTIAQSSGTISTGAWTHVAVTFNGAGSVAFYIQGSPAGTGSAATTNPTNAQAVDLGRAYNGNYFNGKMDEVAIFNSELTASEISNIYNNKAYPEILSIWRFEDDATDSVGSNDGTLNNFVSPQGFVTDKPY